MPLPVAATVALGIVAGAVIDTAIEIGARWISDDPVTKTELRRELGSQFKKQGKKALNKQGRDF